MVVKRIWQTTKINTIYVVGNNYKLKNIFHSMAKNFKDKSRQNGSNNTETENGIVRVRLPRGKQIIGVISQRLGNSRMFVSCMDGKTRNCRVPGSKKRGLWLREDDIILIEPWEFDDDKGDVEYKYTPNEARKLKELGYLQTSSEEF